MADLIDVLDRPVLEAAPLLLGATFTHGGVTVRLTEVEAYDGPNDPAPTRTTAAPTATP